MNYDEEEKNNGNYAGIIAILLYGFRGGGVDRHFSYTIKIGWNVGAVLTDENYLVDQYKVKLIMPLPPRLIIFP